MTTELSALRGKCRAPQLLTLVPVLLLFLSCFLAPLTIYGTEESARPFAWDQITESDWNIDTTWLEEMPDAVMLFEKLEDNEQLLYDNYSFERRYVRIRVLSEAGLSKAAFSVDFAPKLDVFLDLRTRVTLRNGRVSEKLMPELLGTAIEIPNGNGSKHLDLSFPEAVSDCIVEYYLVIRLKIPNDVYTYRDRPVQKDIPLERGEYTRYAAPPFGPEGPHKNYIDLGNAYWCWCGATKAIRDSATVERKGLSCKVTVQHVPAWASEPYSLPDSTSRTQLWYYYSHDPSATRAFQSIGHDYSTEGTAFIPERKVFESIATTAERFRHFQGKANQVEAVYRWLQDSIINTSFYDKPPTQFFAALNLKVKKFKELKKLTDVVKNRYGDWMQYNALFCSLLRALGIQAYPVLITGRDDRLFVPEGGFFQFTSAVIAVRNEAGAYEFYTPGGFALPPRKLHWAYEDVDGLVCSDRGEIVRTSYSTPEMNEVVRVFRLVLNADLTADGELQETHRGHKARLCKILAVGNRAGALDSLLSDSARQMLPGVTATVTALQFDSSFASPVWARYQLSYPSRHDQLTGAGTLQPLLFAPDSDSIFTSPRRFGDIAFQYAHRVTDSVIIDLQREGHVTALPPDTHLVTPAGSCRITYVIQGPRLITTRVFTLNKPLFSVEEYESVRQLFGARATLSRQTVYLEN